MSERTIWEEFDEEEILNICADRGWAVDFGNTTSGPFLPDGIVRIYEDGDPTTLVAEGATLQDAVSGLEDLER